ncbi:MAG: KpsF/GutQ family sugar-phosphate isomerase [Bacteroidaceae bacterium]|jgi:arabinose-5-phosphate isomerase|nr:KpsF/GutQ family sugar-phosphate isomerase [Bacteroidaceae bacterium]
MINEMDIREVAVHCLEEEASAIQNLIPQLGGSFEEAVRQMLACKGKVIVTGVGKSGLVGAKIAATLSSTGTPSFFLNPLDAYHGDLGVVTADDVVLALSNSGQTDELLRIVPYLKEHKIPLIGVSGNEDSLLARNSDIHIKVTVSQEACPLGLAPTSSTTAVMALGDAMACVLMEMRHFRANDFAQLHPGGSLGRRLLTTARDVMVSGELPVIAPEMPLSEAIILVSRAKLGLAVAVEDGKVAGLITDGDVRRAMENLHEEFFHVPVSQVMTRHPKCVSPDEKIEQVQRLMHNNNIHAVLVTDSEGHLLGIVNHFSFMI